MNRKDASVLIKNLHRLPMALLRTTYDSWQGIRQTIYLDDDNGDRLGITIVNRRNKRRIRITGLRLRPLYFSYQEAIDWTSGILESAAELRGCEGEEPPVDQTTHLMSIPHARKRLSVRNAIRLGFAVNQIINDGPTYFTQHSAGGMFNMIDCADYGVPDIRRVKEEQHEPK